MRSRQQAHQEKLKAAGACVWCGKCRACGRVRILQDPSHNCRLRARSKQYCREHLELNRARQATRTTARKLKALRQSLAEGA